jgi:hypothetical protein
VQAEAGTLSDLFFMKYRLEHYDVPREFSQQRTIGVRKFDDDEAGQVGQIGLAEKRMQLFLFPAPQDSKTESRKNFGAGVTSNKRDGLARCRCTTVSLHGRGARHEEGSGALLGEALTGFALSSPKMV